MPPQTTKSSFAWVKWLVLIVPLAGVLWCGWLVLADSEPPDVSDLIASSIPEKTDRDGVAFLKLMAKAAALLPSESQEGSARSISWLYGQRVWKKQHAEDALKIVENAGFWSAADSAFDADVRAKQHLEKRDRFYDLLYETVNVAYVYCVKVIIEADNGRVDEAWTAAEKLLRMGILVERCSQNYEEYRIANKVQVNALDSINYILRVCEPKSICRTSLAEMLNLLASARSDSGHISYLIRNNFIQLHDYLEKDPTPDIGQVYRGVWGELYKPLYWRPNKTIAMFAHIARSAAPLVDEKLTKVDLLDLGQHCERHAVVRMSTGYPGANPLFPINALGHGYTDYFAYAVEDILLKRLAIQSRISVSEAAVALCIFQIDNDELPEQLDQLVPVYISSVPRDYFDGQGVRYSKARREVWSIGPDADRDRLFFDKGFSPSGFVCKVKIPSPSLQ